MDKMVSINKDRLIYARDYYCLSIYEVAQKTSISNELIEKFEEGKDYPSYNQLSLLANFYKQSLFFFFLKQNPPENNLSVAFRQIKDNYGLDLSKKVIDMMEKAEIYRLNLSEIKKDENLTSFNELIEKKEIKKEKELIEFIREKLELPLIKQKEFSRSYDLIEYIREKFYKIGVYIFKDSFKDNDVSGLCLYDSKFPIILLNNKTTFNRQLFTIFHELYHIYLKEADVDYSEGQEEKICNKFASEFLIPEADFLSIINNRSNYENKEFIKYLANLYTVSEDAIMYRLKEKNLISNEYYNNERDAIIRRINSATSGGNFYFTRISYLGKPYLNNIFNLYYSGKITVAQVGTYTNLKPVHVPKLASNAYGGGF